ncbi:MAG TPA: fructose-bisphosphate aldolase class I [Gammaproteobacteria bacterium]|nr:fructose-bisphosphate aldolase class I [Gammaproteobacteria bacterium]
MSKPDQLQSTIDDMVQEGRGILAADESLPTIAKRFKPIGVESTEENRRAYRSLLVTTPGLGEYISAIILFEETLTQKTDDGRLIPAAAWEQRIVPGVKVDKGKIPLALSPGDLITQGLDGLGDRLKTYHDQGARFAKWREVYPIDKHVPSVTGIAANAEMLARYAAVCQDEGFVPIVEPEVLMDGDHDIERCAEVTEAVLHAVFHALHRHHVTLEHMLLKPNMVLPGKEREKAKPAEVAEATLRVLRRTVPAAVPSIHFLSGGQGPEEATANLNAINRQAGRAPWNLSISYGRALQQPALHAWMGKHENLAAAQQALLKRARLNSLAMRGEYAAEMENE